MKNRLLRLRKPALIGAAILVSVLGFAWLALPSIVQSQAQKFIAAKAGHTLTLAKPEINPLALSIRLRDLQLADAAGAKLLGFRELFVDLSLASLGGTLTFDAITLDGLDANLIQQKDGNLNWNPLLAALQDKNAPPAAPSKPVRVDIHRLNLSAAKLAYGDLRHSTPFNTVIEPLNLELNEVSTLPNDSGKLSLNAKTIYGAQVEWTGDIGLNPVASSGRLSIRDVDLSRLAPLLQDSLPIQSPGGLAAWAGDYRLNLGNGRLDLVLDQMTARIAKLALQTQPGDKAPRVTVGDIEVKGGRVELASQQLTLAGITVRDTSLDASGTSPSANPLANIKELQFDDIRVDLAQRNATLAAVTLNGADVAIKRDADGKIDLLAAIAGLTPKPAAAATAKTPVKDEASKEPAAAPWRYRIERVALGGIQLGLRDEALAQGKPVQLALDRISLETSGVSENLKTALPLKASLEVRSGGRLELSGKLIPADAAIDLQLKLTELALLPVQPVIGHYAALDLAGGKVSADGKLTHNAKSSNYRGSFAVRDLRLNEAGTKNVFLAWKALASRDLDVTPARLNMSLLSLDGLDTKLNIDKDKTTNLKRVLRTNSNSGNESAVSPAPTSEAQVATAPTAAPPSAPFEINIDRLRFREGKLDFADQSLALPFGSLIHKMRGSINGLSSRPGAPAQLELDGEVDDYGLARAVGQVDLFKPTDFMDLKVIFRNVEMTHLTPYSATFAGRKIDSGKLSLELEYKIKQRQVTGENQIIIDRLELGERVESPTAKDLPLDLAIAILRDSDGRIDLGLPISGSLDDPQFSYGGIIWKAITNVLGKLVTAPFRALGALFGGGENLDKIAFEAGADRLTPPEREKLGRIAAILNKRPGLALTVQGTWAEADRVAIQDLQLRRTVADKSGQSGGEKGDPGPLSTRSPKVQSAIEDLFSDRFGGGELAALKDGFRQANPGQLEQGVGGKMMSRLTSLIREKRTLNDAEVGSMKGMDFHAMLFEKLRAKEVVKDDVLQALATKRGNHALEAIKAAGAPAARISTGAAEKAEADSRDVMLKLGLGKAGG